MNEFLFGQPFSEYDSVEGTNAGILKTIDGASLAHAKAKLDGVIERDSDALSFGKSFHSLLLEDRQDFVVHPALYPAKPTKKGDQIEMKPWNWNATYCKEWAQNQEHEVMSPAEEVALVGMVASVRANPELANIIKGAKNEVSVFAEKNGWKYKGRIDTLTAGRGPIIDFKSTTNAKPEKFVRQAYDNGYFLQAAFYLDLCAMCGDLRDEFWFVAIEKTAPYAHSIIKLRDGPVSFVGMGRARYLCALSALKQAVKTNVWPSYAAIDAELVATPYMAKEMEQAA